MLILAKNAEIMLQIYFLIQVNGKHIYPINI